MKILIALGGNALLRRDQILSAENQLTNINVAAQQLARLAVQHQLVLTHGNGPQVGLLALEAQAYKAVPPYPLDVLGAETQGMVGYLLEQALGNLLPSGHSIATLISRVEVDARDPAFAHPLKPIGPVYTQEEAQALTRQHHWTMAADGPSMRRVVASPQPVKVLGLQTIARLLDSGTLVIAAGGGGIPVVRGADGHSLQGIEAVIDKDLCSVLLATGLQMDCLVIATDVDAIYLDWGQPGQRALRKTTPQELLRHTFADGSMAPKVQAACQFVQATGRSVFIGALGQIEAVLRGEAGTEVCREISSVSPVGGVTHGAARRPGT
jgi:carbamate kinase